MIDKPYVIIGNSQNKHHRRTPQEIQELKRILYETAQVSKPTTIRHLFYEMVGKGAIEKTERDYANVVIRLCTEMRMQKQLPWHWITDSSRPMYKPTSYDSIGKAIDDSIKSYRMNLWNSQDSYVELWCEKDAMTGVIWPVTWEYEVPLLIAKGQASITKLRFTWETIQEIGKEAFIYILSDYDKSGYFIDENIRNKLRRWSIEEDGKVQIHFERIAITEDQIQLYNLPTRPPKEKKGGFEENVELDAMDPRIIRELVREAIENHLPREELEHLKAIEAEERKTAYQIYQTLRRR